MSSLEQSESFLRFQDDEERQSRAKWHLEISRVVVTIPDLASNVDKQHFEADYALREEIQRCWLETQITYTYGLFQSATLLAATVVELSIERYLRDKDLWNAYTQLYEENRRTLGSLVAFCRPTGKSGGCLTSTMLDLCDRLTILRNEAAHMNRHRHLSVWPTNDFKSPNDMDEIEDVSKQSIGEQGEVRTVAPLHVGEPIFIHPFGKMIKVRAFKLYAQEATSILSQLSGLINQLR